MKALNLSDLGRSTFDFGTRVEADACADTIKKLVGRDASVDEIQPYGGEHNDEFKYRVEIQPILKAPGVADIEEALQSAWEQFVEQHVEYAGDNELDLREMACEAWPNKGGFYFRLPLAGVGFKITIEEFSL